MAFNKDIIPYLDGELESAELNDFLHHMDSCSQCREELEINFIVKEGIKLLDKKNSSYDLKSAFAYDTRKNRIRLKIGKALKRLSYITGTLVFWSVVCVLTVFLRQMYVGY